MCDATVRALIIAIKTTSLARGLRLSNIMKNGAMTITKIKIESGMYRRLLPKNTVRAIKAGMTRNIRKAVRASLFLAAAM